MQIGATYLINSSRKGAFVGKLVHFDDTWASFNITAGQAYAMLEYNEKHKGDKVTVRRSFCSFTEQPEYKGE